ncbi:AraC-like DNA-binding protein [Nocardia pseudobrasiliensis]|uniref:AraC-like DNA-binding protein n=2 Tax=Nocardia pseudobrasiliensis TaxID=45979 RepID=A0A370I6W2_9NOCA|nr:AraC-like DNA-binding protein [Nocardia pseudobrasiliensis]
MAGFRSLATDPIEQRVIAHPSITLIFEFGEGALLIEEATGRQHVGSLAAGLAHGQVRMRGQHIACVEVRMSPVVAHAVLGPCPAVLPLDALSGRDAAQLRERLSEATSWDERFAAAEAFLAARITAGPPMDPEVIWAWERITSSGGRIRVDNLAAELGWSRKRLWTRFRSQVGLPPKRAAKLVRFDRAVHQLIAGRSVALIAAECGYVDQSHLYREVLAFSGTTPTALAGMPGLAENHRAYAGGTTSGVAATLGAMGERGDDALPRR